MSYNKNTNYEMFKYPSDLLDSSSKYGGNKVVFFINVAGSSRFTSKDKDGKTTYRGDYNVGDIPEEDKWHASGKALDLRKVAEKAGETINIKIAGMKRLHSAIALHMPNSIMQGTSVSWSEDDVDVENLTTGYEIGSKVMGGDFSGAGDVLKGAAIKKLIGKLGAVGEYATRTTPGNTKSEMLFKGVNYRDFDFNYSFTPKNEKESTEILNIIRMFKYHMLPEYMSDTEFLYIYPSEFTIKFYKGDTENKFIDRFMTSVLTSVRVDYTPNGQFTSFDNGMPQQINLSLSFRELGLATKEIASNVTKSADKFKHGV